MNTFLPCRVSKGLLCLDSSCAFLDWKEKDTNYGQDKSQACLPLEFSWSWVAVASWAGSSLSCLRVFCSSEASSKRSNCFLLFWAAIRRAVEYTACVDFVLGEHLQNTSRSCSLFGSLTLAMCSQRTKLLNVACTGFAMHEGLSCMYKCHTSMWTS